MRYAFWNNGSPRVLRTSKNVVLANGDVVLEVLGPMPARDLYRYEEVHSAPAAHQRSTAPAYSLDGDTITATFALEDRPLEKVRAEKLAALAAHRYAIETGGITVGGADIGTDRDDQAMITGTLVGFQSGTLTSVRWKGAGGFATLDAAAFLPLASAVAQHVEACFAREADHAAAISALTTAAEVATYDYTTGW